MPNILVTGSNGQLGSELRELINHETFNIAPLGNPTGIQHATFHFTDRSTLDITDKNTIKDFCLDNDIEVIVNCAAYTAVDKAEEDEVNANALNHLAVKYMAKTAKEYNIELIHISTDYVFNGENYKPYTEDDATNPQSVYGKTKLLGEKAIQDINPAGAIIIRTSWVYSSFGNNFVKTILRLGKERDELDVIFDQIGTPTYAKDLAEAILRIIQTSQLPYQEMPLGYKIKNSHPHTEIYNFSNEGVCSWYDFAKTIFELSNIECQVNPIETKDYPTPVTRPHYSLLNKAKIKDDYGISIPYWKDSLNECLITLKKHNN